MTAIGFFDARSSDEEKKAWGTTKDRRTGCTMTFHAPVLFKAPSCASQSTKTRLLDRRGSATAFH